MAAELHTVVHILNGYPDQLYQIIKAVKPFKEGDEYSIVA